MEWEGVFSSPVGKKEKGRGEKEGEERRIET